MASMPPPPQSATTPHPLFHLYTYIGSVQNIQSNQLLADHAMAENVVNPVLIYLVLTMFKTWCMYPTITECELSKGGSQPVVFSEGPS